MCGSILEDGRPVEEGSKHKAAVERGSNGPKIVQGEKAFRALIADADAQFKAKAPPPKAAPKLERKPAAPGLWADRHAPKDKKELMGNGDVSKKLGAWLDDWEKMHLGDPAKRKKPAFAKENPGAKAALLSGPPGIGKSTMAALLCKQRGFEIVEFNASDTRSAKTVAGPARSPNLREMHCLRGGSRRRRGDADRPRATERTKIDGL